MRVYKELNTKMMYIYYTKKPYEDRGIEIAVKYLQAKEYQGLMRAKRS